MHYVILFGILLVVVVLVGWIVIVAAIRVIGFLLGYVVLMAAVAFAVGLVWGTISPIRILRSSSRVGVRIATPDEVRNGNVLGAAPKRRSAHFDWDHAWPLYVPYQLRLDQRAVLAGARAPLAAMARTQTFLPTPRAWYFALVRHLVWAIVFGIPMVGLVAGMWAATGLWMVITTVFRGVVSTSQRLTTWFLSMREKRETRRNHLGARCTRCYRQSEMPSFRCPNPQCGEIHRDVSPGPLGIRTRVCHCEAVIPLTVAAASRSLTAICPVCDAELPSGTGSRRVVALPVFGSVGSGKTQLLASIADALHTKSADSSDPLEVTALTDVSATFLATAVADSAAGRPPLKTQRQDRPEGLAYVLDRSGSALELQMMDAAGESFVDTQGTQSLGYLDISHSLVFVLDPLSIDEVREQYERSPLAGTVPVAQGDAGDAYGSVVDRLRDGNLDLSRRHLAVVVTKSDVATRIFDGDPMPSESDQIAAWLDRHGADGLIRRIGHTFTEVRYFAVDAFHRQSDDSAQSPLGVVDWVLQNQGGAALREDPTATPRSTTGTEVPA